MERVIKVVIVGDSGIGKTRLMIQAVCGTFPDTEGYAILVCGYNIDLTIEDQHFSLNIDDPNGGKDYAMWRQRMYPDTDVFVVGFSLVDSNTLKNVRSVWIPEIQQHRPDTPFLLVGMKQDLRDGVWRAPSTELQSWEAEAVAREIGAWAYLECSAKTGYNCREVFRQALRAVLNPREPALEAFQVEGSNFGVRIAGGLDRYEKSDDAGCCVMF